MRHFGLDEAGYGPNLGPLVIGLSEWTTPENDFDFDAAFADVTTRHAPRNSERVQVADSKAVHSSAHGLANLERTALTLCELFGVTISSFHALVPELTSGTVDVTEQPWFTDDVPLPLACDGELVSRIADRWRRLCETHAVVPQRLAADVVLTPTFNREVHAAGSKGVVLSTHTLALLARFWEPEGDEHVRITCDKHGGRDRYDGLLADVLDGQMIFCRDQGRSRSRYQVARSAITFRTKAEEEFPVAVASCIAKYLREVAMHAFNTFWQSHAPDLRPTKGYPVDAGRFRSETDELRASLGIDDEIFWRVK